MRGKGYILEGKYFCSLKELSVYTGINEKTITARLRRGLSVEDACQKTDLRCRYLINQNKEKSIIQLCREQNKDEELVRNRLRYGYTLQDALNKEKKTTRQGKPIKVHGKKYKSIAEAMRSLGLTDKESTIRRRLKSGMGINQAFTFE